MVFIKKKFTSYLVFIIPTFALLGLVAFSILWKVSQDSKIPLALINYVPNFDKLNLTDLPTLIDNRNIFTYNNHMLVVGFNRIIELDPVTNSIVRINNTNVLDCVNQTAIIGNYLYIACYMQQHLPENSSLPYSILYKLNLETGKIVKTYFNKIPALPSPLDVQKVLENPYIYIGRKANLNVVAQGPILWMSSWDGVMRMDTRTEKITSYTAKEVFHNTCLPDTIFNDNGVITVTAGTSYNEVFMCKSEVVTLNSATNQWVKTSLNEFDYVMNQRKRVEDKISSLKLPSYISISDILNGTRYLLANDGVYSLQKGAFPKKIISGEIKLNSDVKPYVSADGRYILFFGVTAKNPFETTPPAVGTLLDAYVADLTKLTITNLMKAEKFNVPTDTKTDEIISRVEQSKEEEHNGIFSFTNSVNGDSLVTVDVVNATVQIGVSN
jgi:hypothetical protein